MSDGGAGTEAGSVAADEQPPGRVGELLRVRLDLSYDGTAFAGWATQPHLRTVQGTLEAALGTVLRTAPPRLTVAGRTDAGVHARGQVAHVDLDREVWTAVRGRLELGPGPALARRLAGVLPPDVVVHRTEPAPDGFDARFSALRRCYTYRLSDEPSLVDPLRRHHVVRHRRPLDVRPMTEAAAELVGRHDFAAFCKPRPGATTIRTLERLVVERPDRGADAGLVVVRVEADAFCHSMVRAIVGALLAVGEGRHAPTWPGGLLRSGARDAGPFVAPAHGLTLEQVVYPPAQQLAERAAVTRARRQAHEAQVRDAAAHPAGARQVTGEG